MMLSTKRLDDNQHGTDGSNILIDVGSPSRQISCLGTFLYTLYTHDHKST